MKQLCHSNKNDTVTFQLPPDVAKGRNTKFIETENSLFHLCEETGIEYKPPELAEKRAATKRRRLELNHLGSLKQKDTIAIEVNID